MVKYHRFEVEGQGAFPVDMLRYDSCWPDSTDDALKISAHRADGKECVERRRVTLVTVERLNCVVDGRWQSFNWRVVKS